MPEELEWKTRKDRVDRKLISLHPAWAIVKYRPDLDWSRSSIVDTKSIMLPGVVRGPAGKALGVWPPSADARYPAWMLPISQFLRLR